MNQNLPEFIVASRNVTYSVEHLVSNLKEINSILLEDGEVSDYEPSLDELLDLANEYAQEDLSCGWGHTVEDIYLEEVYE